MERARQTKVNLIAGFLITALFGFFMLIRFSPLEGLEEKLFDYRFKIRGPIQSPENIVIAAIDEKSLQKLGRWPWGREKIAKLVRLFAEGGAEVILIDIIFSEGERNDPLLSRTIREAGNVLLPIVFEFDPSPDRTKVKSEEELLLHHAFKSIAYPEKFKQYCPISARRVLLPVPQIAKETMALGHANMFPDPDGTLRWEAMAIEYHGYLYPSIDLQAASIYLGIPPDKIVLEATQGIRLGEKRYIPNDPYARSLIPYYGPMYTFKHYPVSDILDGTIDPKRFQGKIVLVGATAVGIYDLRVTPYAAAMPGIEKHASVIGSILENRLLKTVSPFTRLILLLFSGFLFTLFILRVRAMRALILTGIFLLLIMGSGYYGFVQKGLWLPIAYPTTNILLIFITVTAYNYAVEERYARKIRAMFSNYATERVVDALIKNPGLTKLGGERREVTVLFSDIRGFTTFSERHTPEEVVAMLNEYLGEMTEIIFRWNGTLDKFVGDEIVAFWGAPTFQENHAELAVKCALHMVKRLKELQRKWQSEGKPILDSGIGINTGEVLVGNIGAEGKKMDYTVIGDHVNLGARVEGLTRKYEAQILITEYTLDKIKEAFEKGAIYRLNIEALEKVTVKGKEKPVTIYKLEEEKPALP